MLNRSPLKFIAKAQTYLPLCNLAVDKYPDEAIAIHPIETWYQTYTFARLTELYKNQTEERWDGEAFNKPKLVEALNLLITALPMEEPIAIPEVPLGEYQEKVEGAVRPVSTSKTGQVWEIADNVYQLSIVQKSGKFIGEWKDLRHLIIRKCEEAGINKATASTQYAKWKSTKECSK